ncbi:MAG: ABC transporter substrate-binding protein, partial [Microbacteriaceae bacterium]
VKWHDGKPFTSADVVYNLTEVFTMHPTGALYSQVLDSAVATDAHTVVIKFKEPFAPFPALLTDLQVYPAHIFEGTDLSTNPANSNPVGLGPYKFVEQVTGDFVRVERNTDYYGEQGGADEIIFKVMPDSNARSLALQSGDVDYIPATFFELTQKQLFDNNASYELISTPGTVQSSLLFFNLTNKVLSDYEVRKAIFHGINREEIADKVFAGTAEVTKTPVPNQIAWAADPSIDYSKDFAYDPTKAAAILDAAGYKADANGVRFEVRLAAMGGRPTWQGPTEIIKANLEQIGISVDLQVLERNLYIDSVYNTGDFDMVVTELAAYADPTLGVARSFVCNPNKLAFMNASIVCSEAIDQEWALASQFSDIEKRQEHFYKAQQMVTKVLNALPLNSAIYFGVARTDKWEGFEQAISAQNQTNWNKIQLKK